MSVGQSHAIGLQAPQPDASNAIADFEGWLAEAPQTCLEFRGKGPPLAHDFIPFRTVKQYFTVTRVYELLLALFPSHTLPISAENVIKTCPLVFCVLLSIGRGAYIKKFFDQQGLRDISCPLTSRPVCFPGQDTDFWREFSRAQWRFFPMILEPNPPIIASDRILPYVVKEQRVQGGSAKLYRVVISREYDKLDEEAAEQGDDASLENHEYALKTFDGIEAKILYENEVQNFARLQERHKSGLRGLVRFYAAYQHGNTFNILFEYANCGSLERLLRSSEPPSTGKELLQFWQALMEVLNALEKIHELKESHSVNEAPKLLQGIHQDVRPKNILVFRHEGHISLKLCDLGITHFNERTYDVDDLEVTDTMGGEAYGAPETFRETDHDQDALRKITRKIDIWSLGCVFLVVAVWIAYGKDGVQRFHKQRFDENHASHSKGGCCFHNGQRGPRMKILSSVDCKMEELQMELKRSDWTTGNVINTMVRRMLRLDPSKRPSAAELTGDATGVLEHGQSNVDNHYNSIGPRPGSSSLYGPSLGQGTFSAVGNIPHQIFNQTAHPSMFGAGHGFGDSRANTLFHEPQPLSPTTAGLRGSGSRGRSEGQSGEGVHWGHPVTPSKDLDIPTHPHMTPIEGVGTYRQALAARGSQLGGSPMFDQTQLAGTPTRSESARKPRHVHVQASQSTSTPDVGYIPEFESAAYAGTFEIQQGSSDDDAVAHVGSEPLTATTERATEESSSTPAPRTAFQKHNSESKQPQKAFLSVAQVLDLIREASRSSFKRIFSPHKVPQLSNGHYKDFLKDRDHLILIDDSASMRAYADHVRIIFQVITYMTIDADPDGIDVQFTHSRNVHRVNRLKDMDSVAKLVRAQVTKAAQPTDIKIRLGAILDDHAARLQDRRGGRGNPVRQLSIYVLTDGVWGRNREHDADAMITEFARKLKELQGLRYQVGIQFISFGNDRMALERLQRLDKLSKGDKSIDDIVDTTDHQDNVWKMLLGAIDTIFDDD